MTKSLAHAAAWGAILRATLGQAEPSQEELLDHPGDWTSEDALYRWEELDLKKLISVEEEEERDLWPIRSNKKCLRKDESDYRGRVAVTISGRPCQAWSSQLPHQHRNTPENRGDSGVAHHNFCRNPGGSEQGAWCYTIDKRVRWERCDVRCGSSKPEKVNANCIAGSAYRGRISTTKTGKECIPWTWHPFPYLTSKHQDESESLQIARSENGVHDEHGAHPLAHADQAGLGAHNYCRSPDGQQFPWCYVQLADSSVEQEACDLDSICKEVENDSSNQCLYKDERDYRGKVSVTASGRKCQRWDQQTPHSHCYSPHDREMEGELMYEDFAGIGSHNFCRNPGGAHELAWCFTTDPGVVWEYCDVGCKANGCKHSNGADYEGTTSVTESGRHCRPQYLSEEDHLLPIPPELTKMLEEEAEDKKTFQDSSICHNPGSGTSPFCWVQSSSPLLPKTLPSGHRRSRRQVPDRRTVWEYCDVSCAPEPVEGVAYPLTKAVYRVGARIPANVPVIGHGSRPLLFRLAPLQPQFSHLQTAASLQLPQGLSLDPFTGRIDGVPTAVQPSTIYNVSATNEASFHSPGKSSEGAPPPPPSWAVLNIEVVFDSWERDVLPRLDKEAAAAAAAGGKKKDTVIEGKFTAEVEAEGGKGKCVFPFEYAGKTFHTCTDLGTPDAPAPSSAERSLPPKGSGLWCRAEKGWGQCVFPKPTAQPLPSTSSEVEPSRKAPVAVTTHGGNAPESSVCMFPFSYKEKVFEHCTSLDSESGAPWCYVHEPNEVTIPFVAATRTRLRWGYCVLPGLAVPPSQLSFPHSSELTLFIGHPHHRQLLPTVAGSPPFTFSTDKPLPLGLVMDPHTGAITGMPRIRALFPRSVKQALQRIKRAASTNTASAGLLSDFGPGRRRLSRRLMRDLGERPRMEAPATTATGTGTGTGQAKEADPALLRPSLNQAADADKGLVLASGTSKKTSSLDQRTAAVAAEAAAETKRHTPAIEGEGDAREGMVEAAYHGDDVEEMPEGMTEAVYHDAAEASLSSYSSSKTMERSAGDRRSKPLSAAFQASLSAGTDSLHTPKTAHTDDMPQGMREAVYHDATSTSISTVKTSASQPSLKDSSVLTPAATAPTAQSTPPSVLQEQSLGLVSDTLTSSATSSTSPSSKAGPSIVSKPSLSSSTSSAGSTGSAEASSSSSDPNPKCGALAWHARKFDERNLFREYQIVVKATNAAGYTETRLLIRIAAPSLHPPHIFEYPVLSASLALSQPMPPLVPHIRYFGHSDSDRSDTAEHGSSSGHSGNGKEISAQSRVGLGDLAGELADGADAATLADHAAVRFVARIVKKWGGLFGKHHHGHGAAQGSNSAPPPHFSGAHANDHQLRFSIEPPLPAGLELHPQTGVISGTPSEPFSQAAFVITASTLYADRASPSSGSVSSGSRWQHSAVPYQAFHPLFNELNGMMAQGDRPSGWSPFSRTYRLILATLKNQVAPEHIHYPSFVSNVLPLPHIDTSPDKAPLRGWLRWKHYVHATPLVDGTLNGMHFSIEPALPKSLGLAFNTSTGEIHGHPLHADYAHEFVITARNPLGHASHTIRIEPDRRQADAAAPTFVDLAHDAALHLPPPLPPLPRSSQKEDQQKIIDSSAKYPHAAGEVPKPSLQGADQSEIVPVKSLVGASPSPANNPQRPTAPGPAAGPLADSQASFGGGDSGGFGGVGGRPSSLSADKGDNGPAFTRTGLSGILSSVPPLPTRPPALSSLPSHSQAGVDQANVAAAQPGAILSVEKTVFVLLCVALGVLGGTKRGRKAGAKCCTWLTKKRKKREFVIGMSPLPFHSDEDESSRGRYEVASSFSQFADPSPGPFLRAKAAVDFSPGGTHVPPPATSALQQQRERAIRIREEEKRLAKAAKAARKKQKKANKIAKASKSR